MNPKFETLAQDLAQAWRTRGTVPLPAADASPQSRAEAFEIQEQIERTLGEKIVGWKVGASTRAVQILEGHDGPVVGWLMGSRIYQDPARIPASMYEGYKIECEFAFRFLQDVLRRSNPYTRDEIDPLIVLHPGLEISGSRWVVDPDGRKVTTYDSIADSGTGAGYVTSSDIADWRNLDLEHMNIVARIDSGEAIEMYTGDYRCDPAYIVLETVNGLSVRGRGVAKGDLISTGSLTLPTPLRPGQTFVGQFGDLATLSVTMEP
jgi:2-keto-4-pentenoate hydratase